MRPIAAGADAPDVEGKAVCAAVQKIERRLDVAVEEDMRWTAGAEAAEVDGERMVAGGAQGLDTAAQIEVSPAPDEPRMEEEDGAAGAALRRIPGRRECARPEASRYGDILERRQSRRWHRLGNLGEPRRQRQKTAHCNPFQPGPGPGRYRLVLHHTPLPPMEVSRGGGPGRYSPCDPAKYGGCCLSARQQKESIKRHDPTKEFYHKDKASRSSLGLLTKVDTLSSAFLKLIR